jgi:hypothetical protein
VLKQQAGVDHGSVTIKCVQHQNLPRLLMLRLRRPGVIRENRCYATGFSRRREVWFRIR